MDQEYLNQMGKMEAPIPGSSLANNPDEPLPFEGPPEFTKKKDALEYIFTNLTRPEVYSQMIEAIASGSPVIDLTQTIMMRGFIDGKWNPDLFLMLIEPTTYMIMALAERAQVDYSIDGEDGDEETAAANELNNQINSIKERISKSKVKAGAIPKELEEKIADLPIESLIPRPNTNPETLLMSE